MGSVDQGNVRERLREVANQPLGPDIVFLREQSNIIAQPKQSPEELIPLLLARP
jgi:hypothetical protein